MKRPLLLLVALLLFSIVAPGQSDVRSLITASEKFEREDNFPQAIDAIRRAIELQPDSADLYNRRGMLHYGTAEREKAVADFKKAAELGPDDKRIVLSASRMLRFFDHCPDALRLVEEYVARNRADAEVFFERSHSKKCLHDLPGAYEDVNAAIEIEPTNNTYRSTKAALLNELGDSDKAFEMHGQLIASVERKLARAKKSEDPSPLKRDLAGLYRARAKFLHGRGETEAEFADLAKMIEHMPTFYHYQVRADLFADHQMYREAVSDLTEAIRVSNHPPIDSLIRRAEINALTENYADAVMDYETALKIEGLVNRQTIELRLSELRKMLSTDPR